VFHMMCGQGLVADALGRSEPRRARKLSRQLLRWGVALGGSLSLLYAALELTDADVLPRFFTDDAEVVMKASRTGVNSRVLRCRAREVIGSYLQCRSSGLRDGSCVR
jgi:hypothetical protein